MPFTHLLLFLVGLIALVGGAELFIRGAVRVAQRFGVSPFLIGLTLVGFGTSAPELVVTLSAVFNGSADIAIGNVVGSNISNIGLILGLTAIVAPIKGERRLRKIEVPIVIAASIALWITAFDRVIDRLDGLLLFVGFCGMLGYIIVSSRSKPVDDQQEGEPAERSSANFWISAVLILAGMVGLVGGAHLMVEAAVAIATAWGVSEVIIGLTIVAVGTSLPELASSATAAYRGHSDIAIGNVVGSNIFNVLMVLGLTAGLTPLPVPESILDYDLPVMIGFAVLLLLVLLIDLTIRRWVGVFLVVAYVGNVVWMVMRSPG